MPQRRVAAALEGLGLGGSHLLVAVSGGVDSTVLAHLLWKLREEFSLEVSVAHIHHGLRGAAADGDEAFVERFAGERGLAFVNARVDPDGWREGTSSRERRTRQEAARELRYEALRKLAARAGATRIATAHQADDQAETLLLRLLRGCGPDGLAGIPAQSEDGVIVRPLLALERSEIERYASQQGLEWREDASNAELHYTRNRLRHRWLPGLQRDFNPRLLRTLGHLAEAHRRDAEWLATLVATEAEGRISPGSRLGSIRIDRAGWGELPLGLSRRLLRKLWLESVGGRDLSRVHLERVHELLSAGRPGATLELPGGWRMRCGNEDVELFRARVDTETAC